MRAGLGLGLGSGGGSLLLPETRAYIAAMEIKPTANQAKAINARVKALIAGGVWPLFDQLLFYDIHDATAALIDAKVPTRSATNNGCAHTAYNGYLGSAVVLDNKYIDSGIRLDQFASGRNQDLSIFYWSNTNNTTGDVVVGVIGANGIYVRVIPRAIANTLRTQICGGTLSYSLTGTNHFVIISRDGSNVSLYVNGVLVQTQEEAGGDMPTTHNVWYLAVNNAGTIQLPSNKQIRLCGIAKAMTESQALSFYNAILDNPVEA